MKKKDSTTIVLPTLSTNNFIKDQWEKTKGIANPKFSAIDKLFPDQEFQIIILIGDYKIVDHKTNLKVSCHIEDENGKIILTTPFDKNLQLTLKKHIGFILLPELPKFSLDKECNEEEYSIVVNIKDINSGEEETITKKITLNKKNPSNFSNLQGSREEWRQNYYLNPKPTELLSFYLETINEIGIDSDASIQFYVEALNSSLFLVKDLNQLLIEGTPVQKKKSFWNNLLSSSHSNEISQQQRNGLNLLLARSQYKGTDLSGFSDSELKIFHEIKTEEEGLYDSLAKQELTHPSELDILWSIFFANGEYKSIEKIIATLSYKEGKNEDNLENLTSEEQIQYAMGSACAWSLEVNGRSHDLVRTYMIHKLNSPDISEYIQNELVTILTKISDEYKLS